MLRYIGKRLIQIIPIVLIVAILIFTLMDFVPGDPIQIILGDTATEVQIESVREELGLNEPYLVRLMEFLKGLVRLDFGNSYQTRTSVGEELITRFPNTLTLAISSILISVLFGIPIGIRCALKAGKTEDRVWMFITMLSTSMPGFWLALLLVLFLSVKLGWFPSSGIGGPKYFVIPVLANSIGSIAMIARQTRSSMLEVIRSDFISTARSKGISEQDIIWKHALPNALIPIITVLGASFGHLLGGTTVIEQIFSIPGIGYYMLTGINNRDYSVVQGCIIYIAVSFSIIMLLTDLIYAFVDPRIKAQYINHAKKGLPSKKENDD